MTDLRSIKVEIDADKVAELVRSAVKDLPAVALDLMTTEVREVNQANGWYEDDRTFGDDIALLHSEVSEALEAFRSWGFEDKTDALCAECGRDNRNGTHAALEASGHLSHGFEPKPGKPEGVGSELADVLIRLLDTADRAGVDLAAEYHRKVAFNRTRGHRHGGKAL